ncbi:alpha/beta hydrolase [Streptomyces sp. B1I3]|uniref:alpha/beta hydrolase n=1 Tax=Streptomyces sp. B1I3 TaxID=3042264 RepID=UPI0027899CC7|nr:alpha/beta hydrolase [Streptomyces sp. B1I3]MDQ0791770.1 acetyl esterase/lipase [Streptomyces sp. B1I3]
MTAFILVSGMFTGPHVWHDTAARLTAAGSDVRTVPLGGLGGVPAAPGAVIDLESHIADVVAVIDSVARTTPAEIVLVGHDYGIHPVLGAADRRAESIARIVYLDSGLPQDGVPALASVADRHLREEVMRRAAEDGSRSAELPPPAREDWQLWGSVAGVPDSALDRLTELAEPQPLGTLLQPLSLTGAVSSVPFAGVLCTHNGAGIAMVQARVDLGEPSLQALADPRVTFFELATGHWPMLSSPDELAQTLLQAAAGEGHRLAPANAAEPPAHLRPFLLDLPAAPVERIAHVDLHLPSARGPRPAVLIMHGGPVPAGARPTPREWPGMVGYARYAAARGVVGVTVDHRLHDVTDYERAADDVAAAVELVRSDPRVDADRIALWFFSGSGLISAEWLAAPPPWLRCLAANYPVMAPLPNWGRVGSRFSPADAIAHAGDLPVVLVRVGLETAEIAVTVEAFLGAAKESGANIEVVDVPDGHHSFEAVDPTDASRAAVHQVMRSVMGHLTA